MKSINEKIAIVYDVGRYTEVLEETYNPVSKLLLVIPFSLSIIYS
jgi:hypothetical protein